MWLNKFFKVIVQLPSTRGQSYINYTGYFTCDNEPDGIENATHNTFPKLTWIFLF
jgi:hypothetical protein